MQTEAASTIRSMLDEVGLTPEDLFADIPQRVRRRLEIPEGKTDRELEAHVTGQLARNRPTSQLAGLLGGGSYAHWLPPETRYLATRGEFLTAYTPYQAEINQGILQALFEFQTLTARLLELDVANTGVYDGASGAGEAVLMALRTGRGTTVLVPEHVPAHRRSILHNYITGQGGRIETVPSDPATGTIDLTALEDRLDDDVACVHVESPNALGCLEPMAELGELLAEHPARFTCLVPEITSLGLLHGPGHWGVDIAAAEGQPLALPPSFGGPALGLFAAREKLLRKMPGRIVGKTTAADDREAYCLTLQTREQHIRRSRATSNICTNQSFLAVLFTTTLATYGQTGFRALAEETAARARDLRERLAEAGATVPHAASPHYNEFLFEPPGDLDAFVTTCREAGVTPGIPATKLLGQPTPGLVACVTETVPDEALDAVVEMCKEVA